MIAAIVVCHLQACKVMSSCKCILGSLQGYCKLQSRYDLLNCYRCHVLFVHNNCMLHAGKSALETVLTVLHAGGKFGGEGSGYKVCLYLYYHVLVFIL